MTNSRVLRAVLGGAVLAIASANVLAAVTTPADGRYYRKVPDTGEIECVTVFDSSPSAFNVEPDAGGAEPFGSGAASWTCILDSKNAVNQKSFTCTDINDGTLPSFILEGSKVSEKGLTVVASISVISSGPVTVSKVIFTKKIKYKADNSGLCPA